MDPNSSARQSLQEQAYRAIRSLIVSCRLRPGLQIKEGEIANLIGLGRMPVRQAFARLQNEGLVTIHPRRGVEVRGLELGELLEIIEARLIAECHAAGLAAERATPSDLTMLEEILLRSGAATDIGETEALMELDSEFHGFLARIAGNTVLAEILRNLQDRAIRFWFIAVGQRVQRQAVVAQHAEIVSAIASGNRSEAEAAMRRHIEDLRANVLRQPGLL